MWVRWDCTELWEHSSWERPSCTHEWLADLEVKQSTFAFTLKIRKLLGCRVVEKDTFHCSHHLDLLPCTELFPDRRLRKCLQFICKHRPVLDKLALQSSKETYSIKSAIVYVEESHIGGRLKITRRGKNPFLEQSLIWLKLIIMCYLYRLCDLLCCGKSS